MGVAAVAAGCLAGKSIGGDSFDYLVSLESNQANYEACAKTEGGMRV